MARPMVCSLLFAASVAICLLAAQPQLHVKALQASQADAQGFGAAATFKFRNLLNSHEGQDYGASRQCIAEANAARMRCEDRAFRSDCVKNCTREAEGCAAYCAYNASNSTNCCPDNPSPASCKAQCQSVDAGYELFWTGYNFSQIRVSLSNSTVTCWQRVPRYKSDTVNHEPVCWKNPNPCRLVGNLLYCKKGAQAQAKGCYCSMNVDCYPDYLYAAKPADVCKYSYKHDPNFEATSIQDCINKLTSDSTSEGCPVTSDSPDCINIGMGCRNVYSIKYCQYHRVMA